jgi:LDH2 family malate/lactate/ureidoglycolate dehydrogenase
MEEAGTVRVDFDILEQFMVDTFTALGVPEADAQVSAEVLITADKRGIASHGIARLKSHYYDRIRAGIQSPTTQIEVVRESSTTAVLDGHDGMGHLVAKRAMQLAIDKAAQLGMGMVVVRNSTHYGIAGYYAMMAAEAGMIGMTGTNARPSIAPTFGVENMLGTNPLTFGMPTDEAFPFVLDCATSIVQRGKVEVYARAGKAMPAGWVIDENGETATDSQAILKLLVEGRASLLPLGGAGEETSGYKGYGYATVVEILSSALQSGSYLRALMGFQDGKPVPIRVGHFFQAVNISHFIDLDEFKKNVGDLLRELRSSKKAPGCERIYTAGEKEYLFWQAEKDLGVPINPALQKELLAIRNELGLTKYQFKGFAE